MVKNSKKISKKLATIMVAVLLVLTSIPVYAAVNSDSTKTVTLNASKIATGDERFAAYLFDGSDSSKFVNMNKSGNNFTANIPTSYSKIIFCRMTGASTTNSWNYCWNQTSDLNLNDGNVYTLTGWGSGNKMNGYWSNKTETTTTTTTKATTTTTKAQPTTTQPNGTYLVGTFNNWDITKNPIEITYRGGAAQVDLQPGNYEFKFVSVYGGVASYWYGADNASVTNETTYETTIKAKSPGNNIKLKITNAGTYSFYLRMDTNTISISKVNGETTTTVAPTTTTQVPTTTTQAPTTIPTSYTSLVGTFNNWDYTKNPITTTYRGGEAYVDLKPGSYEFKFVSVTNGKANYWYGANETITNETSYAVKIVANAGNIKLNITEEANYTFYFRMDTGTISVYKTYVPTSTTIAPTTTAPLNGTCLVGSFNNWNITQYPITVTYRGGSAQVYLEKGSYEFKFVSVTNDKATCWYGADNTTITNTTTTGVKVKSPGSNIKLNITEAGNYSFYFRMDTGTISVSKV